MALLMLAFLDSVERRCSDSSGLFWILAESDETCDKKCWRSSRRTGEGWKGAEESSARSGAEASSIAFIERNIGKRRAS